jgi:Chitobiase/beta-hexosaminidase C-terminal domain
MTATSTSRHRRGWAAVAVLALGAGTLGAVSAVPASGFIPPNPGVRAGKSITVFHNIDFVAVFGYGPVGRQVTVRVVRNGVTIGSATGPTVETPEGPGLEVNHGPEGAPVAGDCWQGSTPDIKPGDRIVVTDGAGRDEVIVDNIAFTGDPVDEANGDVTVPFTAINAVGTPIPIARIDSAEFRAGSRLRFEATDITVEPSGSGVPGEYQMRYVSPFTPSRNRDLLEQDQLRTLLLGDGHAIGFGHVAPPPREAMLVDGLADTPGPAPGCDAPAASAGVTFVSPSVINIRNSGSALQVQGMSNGAAEVVVQLNDVDTQRRLAATLRGAAETQTWVASFPATALARMSGNIRVTAFIDGVASSVRRTVVKDVVRPNEPRASLRSGTYRGPQRVSFSAGAGERIKYTIGNGTQARPTLARGQVYSGGQILIRRSKVLKVVAIDRANNVSPVARFSYRIR